MNQSHYEFVRHYRAPLPLAEGQLGTWYGEYWGIFTVREFILGPDDRAVVAPFEMPYRERGHPTGPPPLAGVESVSLQAFESLWERFAQPRLHAIAVARPTAATVDAHIRYFRSPFPAEFKVDEAASDIYYEYAAGVARRSFEVYADCTLVAPYEVGIPEDGTDVMLRAAYEGLTPDGTPIGPYLRPAEISHAAFEQLWEQMAIPRLHELADLSTSTQSG